MKRKLLYFLFTFCFVESIKCQIILPNMPAIISDTITNAVGYITAFEHDSATKKLYIAGEFERVGTVNRQGFAVIDVNTGAVLNDLSFITLNNISNINHVKARLKIFNHRIYIGGAFDNSTNGYLFSVNLNNNNVQNLYNLAPLSDFEIYNSKIYTAGASYLGLPDEFTVNEMDTLGNVSWQKSIINTTNEHLSCLAARNNTLFVGGIFTSFGGVSLNNIAKIDLTTHIISGWQISPAPGPSGNVNCYEVVDMAIYPNDVLVNITTSTCATPPKNIVGYSISTGVANPQIRTIPFNFGNETLISENDTSFWYHTVSGLKLYGLNNYVGPWSATSNTYIQPFFRKAGYLFTAGSFTVLQGAAHKGLGAFCMGPAAPKRASVFTKACQGRSNLVYIVTQVKDAISYVWSYTGTGVTINGIGSSVFLNFSTTATSGTFKICGKSYCGATGDTLYIPFTVYPVPNVNAGPDVRFTCSHNVDSLKGSSTTPGATFAWYGPSYNGTGAIHQITTTWLGGQYRLWVTDPVSGCISKDTALVIFDTLPPTINHNLPHAQLTCKTSVIPLDASALYNINALLHWSGNSFSQPNPANITVAGIYTLTITSGTNDCVNTDTFVVKQNIVPPNISAPAILDTITCARDSIKLPANTTSTNAILYWKHTLSDSLLNNSYTHSSGQFIAHALDTSNGCSNQVVCIANQFTTLPVVQLPPGNFSINCSVANVTLNGSSPNTGATLSWTGPNSFSSSNPATATQAGYYFLSVTNPKNGCTAKDSLQISLLNILLLNSSNDTTICNGSSVNLNASPIGGTSGFIYLWNNGGGNTSTVTVSPTNTTNYIVTITDNAGCIGKDSVTVMVPTLVSDSVHTFQPCDPNNPNGQIQAYGMGGIPPYQYTINNGAFQNSGIFTGLNFGTYTVTIKDTLGCQFNFSSIIDQSSILPTPDFILSTSQTQNDTFVIVDISNPRPDSVQWILPTGCTIINNDPFSPQIINADTGAMQITMVAWFGTCEMQLTKNITVIKADTTFANNHNNNGIASLVLYPNPNSGQFTVHITLYKKQSFAIFIFDALGNEILRIPYSNLDFSSAGIHLNNPAPGSYILKVIAEYDSRTKTFLINQH